MVRAARARARARTRIQIEPDGLLLLLPDGAAQEFRLAGTVAQLGDATFAHRFVRHLHVSVPGGGLSLDLITPPEHGAIAPRAAQLPRAPDDAAVIERAMFEVVAEWVAGGGRLSGHTIDELARVVPLASPAFAVTIGERAAQIAHEATWTFGGPMRGGGAASAEEMRRRLRPFEVAARTSERAAEALVAALAAASR